MPSEKFSKNSIEKSKNKESTADMAAFCKEITDLKEEAKISKITGSSELPYIDPNRLTIKDAKMWKRCNSNSIALADVGLQSEYNREIELERKNEEKKLEERELIYNSRHSFIAFLRQRVTFPQLKKQQEDYENFKKGK